MSDNLAPPQPQFQRDSYASVGEPESDANSIATNQQKPLISPNDPDHHHVQEAGYVGAGAMSEKTPYMKRRRGMSRPICLLLVLVAVFLIVVAIVVPVYFTVIRPKKTHGAGSTGPGKSGPVTCCSSDGGSTRGGDGSTITMEDGTKFVYTNQFGGFWIDDPNDPFNNDAQAQSFSKPLNQSWEWGVDQIRGVNLGGWLVTEPFITPALFQQFAPEAVDEWTLSQQMAANGGLSQLEDHYKTFITEQDFAQIVGAGLNWIRLPIPFWAIEVWEGEPFLERVSWSYALRAIQWARKYGLRVNLDLHTCPGSQNAWNHSGKLGQINFLSGVMGIANAQRVLDYIRIIAEFISQPQYSSVVQIFGVLNEPHLTAIGRTQVSSFYLEAYNTVRNVTGIGEGHGAYVSIHDGFQDDSTWYGFLTGADRLALDRHPYFAFDGSTNTDPLTTYVSMPCNSWAADTNTTMTSFGMITAGEFSTAVNDCGLYVNGIGAPVNYGGNCDTWNIWENWDQTTKDTLKQFILAEMDSLQNYFFWTWKIGNDSTSGSVRAPFWSYKLGLDNGWMPTDPREAIGACASLGVAPNAFSSFLPWQTGGAGAGEISKAQQVQYAWPPTSITSGGVVALLPTYTPTGTVVTLPVPTFTKGIDAGDGWFNPADTQSDMVTVAGCTYPNAWDANTATVPPLCTGAAHKRDAMPAMITPPPS